MATGRQKHGIPLAEPVCALILHMGAMRNFLMDNL